MDVQKFNVINKIFLRKKQKSGKRILFKIILILCLVFTVVSLASGKGLFVSISPVALMLAVSLSGLTGGKLKGAYKKCECHITLGNKLIIENIELDKEDSLGVRNEFFIIDNLDVKEVQCSDEYGFLRIIGKGIKQTKWITKEDKSTKKEKVNNIYLYLDSGERREILKDFQKYTDYTINVLDGDR